MLLFVDLHDFLEVALKLLLGLLFSKTSFMLLTFAMVFFWISALTILYEEGGGTIKKLHPLYEITRNQQRKRYFPSRRNPIYSDDVEVLRRRQRIIAAPLATVEEEGEGEEAQRRRALEPDRGASDDAAVRCGDAAAETGEASREVQEAPSEERLRGYHYADVYCTGEQLNLEGYEYEDGSGGVGGEADVLADVAGVEEEDALEDGAGVEEEAVLADGAGVEEEAVLADGAGKGKGRRLASGPARALLGQHAGQVAVTRFGAEKRHAEKQHRGASGAGANGVPHATASARASTSARPSMAGGKNGLPAGGASSSSGAPSRASFFGKHFSQVAVNRAGQPGRSREKEKEEEEDMASLRALGDWNQRFQKIVGAMRMFDEYTPLYERLSVTRNLIHLAHDFIYSSATYGKIIISELYLPLDQKTIRPTQLGGVAGGEKYIVHNIIFKFAVDHLNLYGSDEAAAKVAGHELKGLLSFFKTGVDVCLPLMALVDYRGFRLSAICVLPISRDTVIYGSNDYGHHVKRGDERLTKELKRAAKPQNIKRHEAGLHKSTSGLLFGPIDMEGHLGHDKRYYLIDFSRVMPPQTPRKQVPMGHLFQLLRPEFVKTYKVPLCSDAFSGFIRGHAGEEEHNREVVQATNYLLTDVIPEFAVELATMVTRAINKGQHLSTFRLTETMHRRGINMRFIGVVRHYIVGLDCKILLLVEMAARVIKNNLRRKLREKMKRLRLPVDEPYRRLVIDDLNMIFGEHDKSQAYWATELKQQIKQKYIRGLSEKEQAAEFPLKTVLSQFSRDDIDGKYLMFVRIQKMSGLKFTTRLNKHLHNNPNNWLARGPEPFDDTDLKTIDPRVKHMNIITHAQGYLFKIEGELRWDKDPFAAQRFFRMALEKFEEALDTDPSNGETLSNRAEVFSRLIEAEFLNVTDVNYFEDHPKVQQAKEFFERAVKAHPCCETLFSYAQFLEKCGNYKKAEECYLRALELNANHVDTLKEYGNFLSEMGHHQAAEQFYVRCSEATKILRGERMRAIPVRGKRSPSALTPRSLSSLSVETAGKTRDGALASSAGAPSLSPREGVPDVASLRASVS